MASFQNVIDALVRAAEAILGRKLTTAERQRLIDAFNAASGSTTQRTREALKDLLSIDEAELTKRASASADTDRLMDDLERISKDHDK